MQINTQINLIDTHCHLNLMTKKKFDEIMTQQEIDAAQIIIDQAAQNNVTTIINVATSIIESKNCIALSKHYQSVFATIGIHPNDCKQETIKDELKELALLAQKKEEHKIVGIGECGIDRHYPDYNAQLQEYAFRQQIELSLTYNLGLVVHSRDAADETLTILDEYRHDLKRVIMHCYSYDQSIAHDLINWGFMLGIGGPITYPKNTVLRDIVSSMPLENLVLETDAPYLPIQSMRGKENHPQYIRNIAEFIAELRTLSLQEIAQQTTLNAKNIFSI